MKEMIQAGNFYDSLEEKDKKELYSSNLFELMGVAPKRDKAPRYTLGKDDNAAQTEEGLGDLTATMLP